jgi:hypothetical protein
VAEIFKDPPEELDFLRVVRTGVFDSENLMAFDPTLVRYFFS